MLDQPAHHLLPRMDLTKVARVGRRLSPFALFWVIFLIGDHLDWTIVDGCIKWWALPYLVTSLAGLIMTAIWAWGTRWMEQLARLV